MPDPIGKVAIVEPGSGSVEAVVNVYDPADHVTDRATNRVALPFTSDVGERIGRFYYDWNTGTWKDERQRVSNDIERLSLGGAFKTFPEIFAAINNIENALNARRPGTIPEDERLSARVPVRYWNLFKRTAKKLLPNGFAE